MEDLIKAFLELEDGSGDGSGYGDGYGSGYGDGYGSGYGDGPNNTGIFEFVEETT